MDVTKLVFILQERKTILWYSSRLFSLYSRENVTCFPARMLLIHPSKGKKIPHTLIKVVEFDLGWLNFTWKCCYIGILGINVNHTTKLYSNFDTLLNSWGWFRWLQVLRVSHTSNIFFFQTTQTFSVKSIPLSLFSIFCLHACCPSSPLPSPSSCRVLQDLGALFSFSSIQCCHNINKASRHCRWWISRVAAPHTFWGHRTDNIWLSIY